MTSPPEFDGPVIDHVVGTVYKAEGLSFGLVDVTQETATIHSWGNNQWEDLDLGVGETGEILGVHVRLCGVYFVAADYGNGPPGSDQSRAYYVVGTGDSAPECPTRTN